MLITYFSEQKYLCVSFYIIKKIGLMSKGLLHTGFKKKVLSLKIQNSQCVKKSFKYYISPFPSPYILFI